MLVALLAMCWMPMLAVAQQALALNLTLTVDPSLTSSPGQPSTTFAKLADAWSYVTTSAASVTGPVYAKVLLLNGTHYLTATNTTVMAPTSDRVTIEHYPVWWTPRLYAYSNGAMFTDARLATVQIRPDPAFVPSNANPWVVGRGNVSLSFTGVTLSAFRWTDDSVTSPWAVFDMRDTSQLSIIYSIVRDAGVANPVFAVTARGQSRVVVSSSFVAAEGPSVDLVARFNVEFSAQDTAALTISNTTFLYLGAWREAIIKSTGVAPTVLVSKSYLNMNYELPVFHAYGSVAVYDRVVFRGNTGVLASGTAGVGMVLYGASLQAYGCTFSYNNGAQTGTFVFANAYGYIADSEFIANEPSVIMVARAAGSTELTMVRSTISNYTSANRFFQISETARVTLDSCVIRDNQAAWIAGSYITSLLRVWNSTITGNQFGLSSFYITQNIHAEFIDNKFIKNYADNYFLVSDRNGTMYMRGNKFIDNTFGDNGGPVVTFGRNLTMVDTEFTRNAYSWLGAGNRLIQVQGSVTGTVVNIVRANFTDNNVGNAIIVNNLAAAVTVESSTFVRGGNALVTKSTVGSLRVDTSTFENNKPLADGSVVFAQGPAWITRSSFVNNVGADAGGAVVWVPQSKNQTLIVDQCAFTGNAAAQDGGAIYMNGGLVANTAILRNVFSKNLAKRGGAIYATDGTEPITGVASNTFIGNSALSGQGPDVASQPMTLQVASGPVGQGSKFVPPNAQTYSGDTIGAFSVVAIDAYAQSVATTVDETFLLQVVAVPVDANATSPSDVTLAGEVSKAILDGSTTFKDLQLMGPPGTYQVQVLSQNERYPASSFNLTDMVTLQPCTPPRIVTAVNGAPVCALPTCSQGCFAGQGTCVAPNVCQCLPDFDGLDCSMRAGYNDAISLLVRLSGNVTSLRRRAVDPVTAAAEAVAAQVKALLASTPAVTALGDPVIRRVTIVDRIANVSVSVRGPNQSFIEANVLESVVPAVSQQMGAASSWTIPAVSGTGSALTASWADVVYQPAPRFFLDYSHPGVLGALSVACILAVLTLFVMGVLTVYRSTPVVRASSYMFCMLICMGLLVGYAVVPLTAGQPTVATCTAQIWTLLLSVVLVLGNLITKTLRISFIFGARKRGRVGGLSDLAMARYSLALFTGQVILLVLWTTLSPPVPSLIEMPTYRYWTCGMRSGAPVFLGLLGAYNVSLIIAAVVLAIQTRGAQGAFRESTRIAVCVYTMVVVAGAAATVVMLPATPPGLSFGVKAGAIVIINGFITAQLFLDKVHIAIFRPDLNNMDALNHRATNAAKGVSRAGRGTSSSRSGSRRTGTSSRARQRVAAHYSKEQQQKHDSWWRRILGAASKTGTAAQANASVASASATGASSGNLTAGSMGNSIAALTQGGRRGGPGAAAAGNRRTVSIAGPAGASNNTISSQGNLLGSSGGRNRHGSNDPEDQSGTLPATSMSGPLPNGKVSAVPEANEEQLEEQVPALGPDPVRDVFQVRKGSRGFLRAQYRTMYVHLFPLTEHVVVSRSPQPVEADVIPLAHCRLRILPGNCLKLSIAHHQMWWLRTRHDDVFQQWAAWLTDLCTPREFFDEDEDDPDGEGFEDDEDWGGSASFGGSMQLGPS
ncbi:polymorphic outer membrane protein [Allomyces macrogynus ATCC 38327]|uniref:Polymorphic outer membrane protein n=1 Tax=Allomyces macrogynus (strain ATCC 38327) TaxID=578462 RepID=A0A0L0S2F6_ALLM3|nr:polymorphic outer membrane protein [Allomyces macrogynus ATCC 38327]|eukprot:KNE56728.1 polymorphic outer membrane protein [Allomyces macrogynus ATCC 38327]